MATKHQQKAQVLAALPHFTYKDEIYFIVGEALAKGRIIIRNDTRWIAALVAAEKLQKVVHYNSILRLEAFCLWSLSSGSFNPHKTRAVLSARRKQWRKQGHR